ncbi:MAG TPA: FAD-dependent oxidoreductase [Acidimicrobiales bacterium]|jgi:3-oxo-5alpha-steroid 4-dehydrogenase|nr:FAD-dependent oxidoreductase [Acidimicrobiales bacterium]
MEPIPALEVNDVRFDETVDVIVVGLGVAGASAVLAARQAGAGVLALERSTVPGGTSANSGGLIYLGGGTALQDACGFQDTPENMALFLRAALGPGVDDDRVDAYCGGSVDHFDWLVSIGVPFRAAFCDEPNRESADDAGLLFSGGEDAYPFDEIATPVPRGHKPRCIDSAGGFLMERLGAALSTSGARVVADARAERLIVDGQGVVGVQVTSDDGLRSIRALGGVILATGGFIQNEAMVAEHCPLAHLPNAAWRIGTPADDGRGIRMGVGAGSTTARLDVFECALPLGPPHRLAKGILVNRHGERFINEDAYTGRIGLYALREQGGIVYMITDDVIHERNVIGLRIGYAAATPEELAVDLGLPADALAHTVREYNEAAARGDDPTFHKRAPYLQAIGVPPASGIGAIDLRVDHDAIYATFTLGGLITDPNGRALDRSGHPISGLYAVGRTSASLAAQHYASGISLGDGSFFGRRAGNQAAVQARTERSIRQ